MRGRGIRWIVVALVAVTAVASFAASAQAFRRPGDTARVSSPEGGLLQVCRDGIRFQVLEVRTTDDPRPTAPTRSRDFAVYSPVPLIDPSSGLLRRDANDRFIGGSVVVRGTVTTQLQAAPIDADGVSFWYLGTHAARWTNGRLLVPSALSVFLDVTGRTADRSGLLNLKATPPRLPFDVERCRLFPVVSGLRLTNRRFRVVGRRTTSRAPAGTAVVFSLSEAARARLTIERALSGRRDQRRVNGRLRQVCVRPERRLANARRCTRYRSAGTLTRQATAGRNRLWFTGRIGGRALAPGSYRVSVVATDSDGNRSLARRARFTIVD